MVISVEAPSSKELEGLLRTSSQGFLAVVGQPPRGEPGPHSGIVSWIVGEHLRVGYDVMVLKYWVATDAASEPRLLPKLPPDWLRYVMI